MQCSFWGRAQSRSPTSSLQVHTLPTPSPQLWQALYWHLKEGSLLALVPLKYFDLSRAITFSITLGQEQHTHLIKICVTPKRQLLCLVTCACAAELMTGGSLSDAMRLARKFTLRRAMEVAVDCARGLAYLHAKKNGAIIHR